MTEFFATSDGGFNLAQVVTWQRDVEMPSNEEATLVVKVGLTNGWTHTCREDEARRFLARVERQTFHDALVTLYEELKRWIENGELLLEPHTMRLFREAQAAEEG